jgi:hypothetical protein
MSRRRLLGSLIQETGYHRRDRELDELMKTLNEA